MRRGRIDAPAVLTWLAQNAPKATHLCLDSRQVGRGDVFFACAGRADDRRRHIAQAVQAGAAAVVVQANAAARLAPLDVPLLRVPGLTKRLGAIAHAWYGQPSEALTVIAVTGTNGKTSTVQWLAAALCAGGMPCGAIGTLGLTLPDGQTVGGTLTTPDVLTLHRSLAQLRDAGAAVAAIEASSIGMDQGRLDGVQIACAGFTNLTHDHLDYHQNIAQYRAAKFSLFSRAQLRGVVVNLDDAAGKELFARVPAAQRLGYTCCADADAVVAAREVQVAAHGQVFQLQLPDGSAQLVTPIPGAHNVSNLLLVAGILHWLGWPVQRVVQALTGLRPVPGRLQVVAAPVGAAAYAMPTVVVDYAHTPDALERALQALRQTAQASQGNLTVVFGCGGNRDAAKRPVMGEIAARLADHVIVTSDNPRDEDPDAIAAQIMAGIDGKRRKGRSKAGRTSQARVILERAQAILLAILQAKPGDVVLLAGKGHELWQEAQGKRKPFDDREWAALALAWRAASGVASDTRTLRPGQLFVALRGQHVDGHQYLAQAAQAGAIAAMVQRRNPDMDLPQCCVGDTFEAVDHMALAKRQLYALPVIAVTGSNGKTTTKEMIVSILRAQFGADAVHATPGNFNNTLGVPLTLLELNAQHRVSVMELGMNHPGEIAQLAAMAQPTVALVNNAQREHQEFMHSVAMVAFENGMALTALPDDGVAVYPSRDEYAAVWDAQASNRARLRFGVLPAESTDDHEFDVYADDVELREDGVTFCLHLPEAGDGVKLPILGVRVDLYIAGLHNVHNAVAAAACAHAVGVPAHTIAQGLADFRPVAGRMHMLAYRGMRLINDAYNANPDSVRAAIDALAQLPGARILVLGDMGEVGAQSQAAHAEVGSYARERGIQTLLAMGEESAATVRAFGTGARRFETVEALVDAIRQTPPAHVLVKGSRFMEMERVVLQLHQDEFQEPLQRQHGSAA